ncbi:MAG: alpha/beta hydrolase [Treponema sp.]|jgi:dienelactone hydrolase|nr:alpha/beta hydrolase [Treponema sp.]
MNNIAVIKVFAVVVLFCAAAGFAAGQTEAVFDDYSLKALQSYAYKPSELTITRFVSDTGGYYAFDMIYTSMGLTVSARFRVPQTTPRGLILMFRGHQFPRGYYTGKGTENIGRRFLEAGYATVAPDFLGFAASSAVPAPVRAHQLYSIINAVELYLSMEKPVFRFAPGVTVSAAARTALPAAFSKFGVWGHSNGGQVAIHFLEIVKKPIPAILWAPVTLDYPDNVAHYGRDVSWAEAFKASHAAADFALRSYLGNIAPGTPILLEQGTADISVPKSWSDDFAAAIAAENARRGAAGKIALDYRSYDGANHDLEPHLPSVWARDVAFWVRHL